MKHDYPGDKFENRPPTLHQVTSWKFENVNAFYNQYKIMMTGKNWGVNTKWWSLRFCGFELYGEMY